MIDVHCHLDDELFKNDLEDVISRAKKAGVKAIITSIISPKTLNYTLDIIRKYEGYVYATIGLDPTILDDETIELQFKNYESFKGYFIGIGEVGLDYFYIRDRSLREKQIDVFKRWIRLAKEHDKPLIVHSRSAGKYAIQEILNEGYFKVIMHAFDGSVGWALEAAKKGVKFSIPPSVVYSRQKQKLVKRLPLESLLLESDSPVLPPEKGVRNEPANIVYSAMKIAEIKNVCFDEVVRVTVENTIELFNLNL